MTNKTSSTFTWILRCVTVPYKHRVPIKIGNSDALFVLRSAHYNCPVHSSDKKKRELLNCFYRIPPTFVELLQFSFLAMLTGIAQEDLRAYVGASGAKLAQYLSERKIFHIKVAENNKTRLLTAYHFSP